MAAMGRHLTEEDDRYWPNAALHEGPYLPKADANGFLCRDGCPHAGPLGDARHVVRQRRPVFDGDTEGRQPLQHREQIGTPSAAPAKSWQQGLSRTDLVRQDLGAADREVIQARVDFEPGVTSPNHAHPGVEVAYVISGTFEYRLEGQAPVTLKAGDSLFIPAAWRISRRMSAMRRARSWRLTS